MIYIAVQLIQIFSAHGSTGIRGGTRGPRGPKNNQNVYSVDLSYYPAKNCGLEVFKPHPKALVIHIYLIWQ